MVIRVDLAPLDRERNDARIMSHLGMSDSRSSAILYLNQIVSTLLRIYINTNFSDFGSEMKKSTIITNEKFKFQPIAK